MDAERRLVGVASGVEQLQRDEPARVVHRLDHAAPPVRVVGLVDQRVTCPAGARPVHRGPAGDHQSGAATGPLGVERRKLRAVGGLQVEVHRPHQHPVRQLQRADGDGRAQPREPERGHRQPRVGRGGNATGAVVSW